MAAGHREARRQGTHSRIPAAGLPDCTTAERDSPRRHGAGRRGSSLEVDTGGGSEIRMAFPVSPARFTSPSRRGRACAAGKRSSVARWDRGRQTERGVKGTLGWAR
jgi:hypothetical protein